MLIASFYLLLILFAYFPYKEKYVAGILFLLSFVSVILSYRASDFPVYDDFYRKIEPLYDVIMGNNHVFFNDRTKFEIGYVLLNSFFKIFSSHVELMLWCVHTYILVNIYLLFKDKADNFFKLFLPYFIFFFISIQVGIVRQMLAILVFYKSIKYIEQRNFLKFLCYAAIAFSFHRTAIILPVVYWICRIKFPNWFYLFMCFVGSLVFWKIINLNIVEIFGKLIGLNVGGVLGDKLVSYYQGFGKNGNVSVIVGYIEDVLFMLLALYSNCRLEKRNESNRFLNISLNLVFLHTMSTLFFRDLGSITYRIIYYFLLFKFFPIVTYIEKFKKAINRNVLYLVIVTYCGIKMYVRILQGY